MHHEHYISMLTQCKFLEAHCTHGAGIGAGLASSFIDPLLSKIQHSSIRTWLAVLYVDRAFCTTFTSPVKRQELFAMTRTCVDVPTLIFGGS